MTDISAISDYSRHKTRVLIHSSHPPVTKLVLHVLHFCEKEVDFFLENRLSEKAERDFVILETSDAHKVSDFQTNIVLISDELNIENLPSILKNITPGGVLVYPDKMEEAVNIAENFFRKLPFSAPEFTKSDDHFVLNTEIGSIPLQSHDENLIKNINGIKLLCQQFGIMEEAFYEPLMDFQ